MDTQIQDRERLLAILEFWHKIEFFIPFDLSGRAITQEGRSVFRIHAQKPEDGEAELSRPHIPQDKELLGFTVFLGVFSKAEIAGVVQLSTQPGDERAVYEDTERGDLDGDTCFASLRLDAAAKPLFGSFEISTLPWALGRVRQAGLSALSAAAFADSQLKLQELLRDFEAQRQLDRPAGSAGEEALTAAEIIDLAGLLGRWAGFAPHPGRPAALVEVRFREQPTPHAVLRIAQEGEADEEDGEDDDSPATENEIGILNSFFIEDIERAIAAVRDGVMPEALRRYLTPLSPGERIDLYTDEGRRALIAALHPENLNRGRWPGEPHHAMSLMQQFAINTALGDLAEEGLFSVNGPPGTGKTTLLRDIIADTIVRRARVLAGLGKARDAFEGRPREIVFSGGDPAYVSMLRADLAGYEMVVASSNNSAVENISRDLPKRESLGAGSSLDYLQPVAHKVAAQKDKGGFVKLEEKDRPWGLIACALGKSANRYAFKERFAFMKVQEAGRQSWSGERMPQTIWQWLESYDGPSFVTAAVAFKAADAATEATIADYVRYADLHGESSLCRETEARRQAAVVERLEAEVACGAALAQRRALESRCAALKEEERLLERSLPGWWHRLFPTAAGRRYRQDRVANARAQIAARDTLSACDRRLEALEAALRSAAARQDAAEAALRAAKENWACKQETFERLGATLGHPAVPESLDDLESDRFQIAGLWHTEALARQRTALFEAALGLHAAWLAEVGAKRGGFGGNIVAMTNLLAGKKPVDLQAIPAIWQSLFMIVPVVSTTFASFARQFHGMEQGSIGWLFVDEAGQAVPQAAVGALMRARRAMVIGDPLQIEPVFTLPAALIHALADLSPHTAGGRYAPDQVSIQTLADAANGFGTAVPTDGGEDLWIGSPLRVHRRCLDPMFSLANRIAYRDKMVFGLKERLPLGDAAPFYGESAWVDIGGSVVGRQTVPEQVAFVADVLVATYRRDGALPGIYIISPFKEVKAALKQAIENAAWIDARGERTTPPPKLHTWIQARVGTVHTFQGKEEAAVFLVLGADAAHAGAVTWAASRPNLLNVAATRAQRRFFIIGDRDLWKGRRYFSDAAEALAVTRAEPFLARLVR